MASTGDDLPVNGTFETGGGEIMKQPSGIRNRTRRAIYELVRERGMATKNEIAGALEISLPTVSKYLSHFIESGLLEQGGKLSSGSMGGRNPVAYVCVPDGRLAVGIDITATRVTTVLVNLERQVLADRQSEHAFSATDDYYAFIADEVEALLSSVAVDRQRILGVGVAVPGLISEENEVVTYGRVIDNFGLSAADFARHLPYRTRLVHDSDAAGLAEFWSSGDTRNAFYVSLSTSVGGSVLIKGEIYRGDGEFAGEIGHVRIHPEGRRCYCGQDGCMDVYCNAGVLSRHADGSLASFFGLLEEEAAGAVEVWDTYTSDLALALHNIRVLFGCSIILGGDVGARIGRHISLVREKVDRLSFLASDAQSFVLSCSYTTHPVATGAALYLVDEFRQELGPEQPHQRGTSGRPPRPTTAQSPSLLAL